MCAVSMISDTYRQWQPNVPMTWPKTVPSTLPWTSETFADLKEILKRLDALDKKLGLEHCEDPKKGEWMAAIEERLSALEKLR